MNETVILIRCMSAEPRVLELHAQMQRALPQFRIIAVPDLLRDNSHAEVQKFQEANIEVLPLTKEYLSNAGLKEAETRTGWVCGDYAFYRALEVDWEYAWVVEPDIYFLNGSDQILAELEQVSHDLIGTGFRKGSPNWHWYDPIDQLSLGMDVYAMSFPLVRMSRNFVESAYEFCRSISLKIQSSQRMPNDESVISSLAHAGQFSILNVKSLLSGVFKYWHTVTRYNIDDICESEPGQLIVHSGRSADQFDKYLHEQLKLALMGNNVAKERILNCLKYGSRRTAQRFVESLLNQFSKDN